MIDYSGNILVVDDTPDNLRLLSAMLSEQGYKVRKALNGQTALNTIRQVPPDLILLDINMPSMNGYEVCEQLKLDPHLQEIPVIFISALDDILDKVKAFQVGGVDYITKPFQGEEVIARIENQLTIKRQKQQLQTEIKERQKVEDSLRIYLHTVSHDLRNPVVAMSMILNNLAKKAQAKKDLSVSLSSVVLERMRESCDRQLHLINSLVETHQLELEGVTLNCCPLSLSALLQSLVSDWEEVCHQHQGTLISEIPDRLPLVKGDKYQLLRVFENLISNALKYNPSGTKIVLKSEQLNNEMVRCSVIDDGIGIDSEQAKVLFDLYQRGKEAKNTLGLGLGLYLCRQIIEAHGGEIGLNSIPNQGAEFWFTLPVEKLV